MSDLIPPETLKIGSWQNHHGAGGQHTNGPPPWMHVEHEPTGVMVVLPARRTGQIDGRKLAVQALEFILTHPEFKG